MSSNQASVPVAVAVVAGLLIGSVAAPLAWGYTAAPENEGTVAVVELSSVISGSSAQDVVRELRDVRTNESIDAVVLRVNSPGGSAAASEALYLAVKRTAAAKPLVVSVGDFAASGGYYAAAPAEAIYVTPGSIVGSVGVRASLPDGGDLPQGVTTGPDKAAGATREEALARVESLRQAFLSSVMNERGDRLELSRTELGKAKVYAGARAVQLGLADRTGGLDAALQRAADEAGIDSYDVTYRSPEPSLGGLLFSAGDGDARVETVRYLMLYGQLDTGPDRADRPGNATAGTARQGVTG
jgi:protease-4